MPRLLPKLVSARPSHKGPRPRLWNAKRRIPVTQGLMPTYDKETHKRREHEAIALLRQDPLNEQWRKHVSQDVIDFVDKVDVLPQEKIPLLRNPMRFFSLPRNVPTTARKQVYFPDFNVTLMRTPHLPPRYAAFDVPLSFNKLDMKSYLKNLYGVETLHIRSTITQAKVERKRSKNPRAQGPMFRPPSKKKMTVELVEPFIWPDEIKDFSPWEKEAFWKSSKAQVEAERRESDYMKTHENPRHRKSIAQQAKDLLDGKTIWKPTWQSIPQDVRALVPPGQGSSGQALPPPR